VVSTEGPQPAIAVRGPWVHRECSSTDTGSCSPEATRIIGLGFPDDYTPLTPRDDFDAAYERTQEMQVITVGLVQGPQVLHEELGREPTASEVLEYVADEVESKSPRATKKDSVE
jgi:hypothetical protein